METEVLTCLELLKDNCSLGDFSMANCCSFLPFVILLGGVVGLKVLMDVKCFRNGKRCLSAAAVIVIVAAPD